ncbi:hypothetical protein R1flu_006679 [Riccia fluitans]|uniref:Uncharacterized protein n=1 Tax=Riccia fluitans TaxID=41844 RepID=A0ABD1YXJ2_9MARC
MLFSGAPMLTAIHITHAQADAIGAFQDWLDTVSIGPQKLENSPSWQWTNTKAGWKGWNQPSRFWSKLIEDEEAPDDKTASWPVGRYVFTWRDRWRKLLDKGGLPRTKLWIGDSYGAHLSHGSER